jgi:hypothetical protein
MNCFEFRKLLLVDPRMLTAEQERHRAECAACAGLAREIGEFEARVHAALQLPVPEALAERVLLRRKMIRTPALHVWALAASLVAAIGLGVSFYLPFDDREERVFAATALGSAHPAVAAIAYVVEHEAGLLQKGARGDPEVMRDALVRLGLKLPAEGVTVQYLGKCPVPGGTGEHVVLRTPAGQVTLILVPDQYFGARIVVAGGDKTAIAAPHGSGGYILIADSLRNVSQTEKLLM